MGTLTLRIAWLTALALGACATPETPPTETPPKVTVHVPIPAEPEASTVAPPGPVQRQRHTVTVDEHPIAVWEKSPPDAKGVFVLVHGRTWSGLPDFDLQAPDRSRSLMDALVAEGFSTYAVDLRGYGETPRDATQWLTPDRAEADVAAVIEWVRSQRSDARVVLLGWSLGSLVGQLVAQRHPESLRALVLYGYPRDPDRTYDDEPADAEPERRATTAKAAAEDFIIPGSISPAAIDAFVEQALAADPVRTDWRGAAQWNALDPAAVKVPTLVIHGERDPYAPVRNQSKLFSRLGTPDRAWVIVPGGDHAAHLEDCGPRFVDAVVGFVRRD